MSEKKDFFNNIINFVNTDWEKKVENVCIEHLYFTSLNISGPYMDVYSDHYNEDCAISCTMYHLFMMSKNPIFFEKWKNQVLLQRII